MFQKEKEGVGVISSVFEPCHCHAIDTKKNASLRRCVALAINVEVNMQGKKKFLDFCF